MGLSFTIAAGLRQRSHSQVWVPWTHGYILLPQFRDSDNLEGHVPLFISPRNRVVWLYPQAGFPLRRLLRLAGLRWRYLKLPSRECDLILIWTASCIAYRYPRKCMLITRIHGNVFVNSFSSNGFTCHINIIITMCCNVQIICFGVWEPLLLVVTAYRTVTMKNRKLISVSFIGCRRSRGP
jgi:hypothetical protein